MKGTPYAETKGVSILRCKLHQTLAHRLQESVDYRSHWTTRFHQLRRRQHDFSWGKGALKIPLHATSFCSFIHLYCTCLEDSSRVVSFKWQPRLLLCWFTAPLMNVGGKWNMFLRKTVIIVQLDSALHCCGDTNLWDLCMSRMNSKSIYREMRHLESERIWHYKRHRVVMLPLLSDPESCGGMVGHSRLRKWIIKSQQQPLLIRRKLLQ